MNPLDSAKDMLSQHDDKVDEALGKVGDALKDRIPGQDEVIDGVVDKVKEETGDSAAAPAADE